MSPITEIEVPVVETVKPMRKIKFHAEIRYAAVGKEPDAEGKPVAYALFGSKESAHKYAYSTLYPGAYVLDIVTGEKV